MQHRQTLDVRILNSTFYISSSFEIKSMRCRHVKPRSCCNIIRVITERRRISTDLYVPIAHLFVSPVLSFFTGINFIWPKTISQRIKPMMATKSISNGTMVPTIALNTNEMKTQTRGMPIHACIVCTPKGIFAKARFNA